MSGREKGEGMRARRRLFLFEKALSEESSVGGAWRWGTGLRIVGVPE